MNGDTERRIPTGMNLIAAERRRQVEVEGYTFAHDLKHGARALRAAAGCYVAGFPGNWPWALEYWKPKDRLTDLIRAGALHLAAVEVWNATRRPGEQISIDTAAAGCASEIDAILAKAHLLDTTPVAGHEQKVRARIDAAVAVERDRIVDGIEALMPIGPLLAPRSATGTAINWKNATLAIARADALAVGDA